MSQSTLQQSWSLLQVSAQLPCTREGRPVHPQTIRNWIVVGRKGPAGQVIKLRGRRFPGGWRVKPEDQRPLRSSRTREPPGERLRYPAGPAAWISHNLIVSRAGISSGIPRAQQRQLAFALVAGQRRGPLELGLRLAIAAQLAQQIAADARQQVIALQGWLGG